MVRKTHHERHEGITWAPGELFHDMGLPVLPQTFTTVGDVEDAMRFLYRTLPASDTASPMPIVPWDQERPFAD